MKGAIATRLALIAALAFVALVPACGFGADQPTGRLGETLTAGDYQLVASNLEVGAGGPDRFTNPKAGNRFVKLHVTVTNLSSGAQHLPIAPNYFTVKDSAVIDNPALPGGSSDWALRPQSLPPGQHIETDLWFEVAANLSPS